MIFVILDDSATVQLTIRAHLEDMGVDETEIVTFKEGARALTFIEENGAHLIFSDVQMPGMDGFEFLEKLLLISKKYASKLFIITADDNSQSIDKMKSLGAKRFIRKPINVKNFYHFVGPEIAKFAKYKNAKKAEQDALKNKILKEETMIDIPDYSAINYSELAEKIGLKEKHIPLLVQSFVSEAQNIFPQFEQAINNKNYDEMKEYAHFVKGSAGNMKFDALYELCKMMELAAQTKDENFSYKEYYEAIKTSIATIPLS